jgi:hypothetical protein
VPPLHAESRSKREDTWGRQEKRGGGARWARTVGIVAPVFRVAQRKPPSGVVAPALEGRVVLRREATEDHGRAKEGKEGLSLTVVRRAALILYVVPD